MITPISVTPFGVISNRSRRRRVCVAYRDHSVAYKTWLLRIRLGGLVANVVRGRLVRLSRILSTLEEELGNRL